MREANGKLAIESEEKVITIGAKLGDRYKYI